MVIFGGKKLDISQKSIGFLIDELVTTSMKCYMSQDNIMCPDLSSKDRLLAAEEAQRMNARRNLLIRKIDEILGQGSLSPTAKTYRGYHDEKERLLDFTLNPNYSEGIAEYVLTLFPPDFKGICVDIGAYDPIWLSNSWLLEEGGWDVHCIEPNPSCISKLKELRKNVYEYACGPENKDDADFFVFTANEIVGEAAGTGLIDFRLDNRSGEKHKKIFSHQLKVKVRTLDWLMENEIKIDHIDYLSIDVERYEMEVLKGTDLNRWRPKIIVIERLEEDHVQSDWLKSFNYRAIHRIVFNDIYIDEDFYQSNLVLSPVTNKMEYKRWSVE